MKTDHIPQDVVREFRASLGSEEKSREFHLKYPSFCEKTMDYFEVMGRMAENAATKDDVEKISDRPGGISEDIAGLKNNDRRQDSRLDKLDHQYTNMSIKMDHVESYTKQIPTIQDSINSLHDTVNIAISSLSNNTPQKSSPPWHSKLPIQAWLAIAAGLAGTLVYIATGEIINFGTWFGGVK